MPCSSARAGLRAYRPNDGTSRSSNLDARSRRAARISAPLHASPCPVASSSGSSAVRRPTESPAACQSCVKYAGGPCSSRRCVATASADSCFVVVSASPAIRVRSRSRNREMCPGQWPGVWSQRHPRSSGTPCPSPRGRRCRRTSIGPRGYSRDTSAMAPPPTSGSGGGYDDSPVRYGRSSGCAYTGTFQASSRPGSDPMWSKCAWVRTIAAGGEALPTNRCAVRRMVST